jgi:SNF2 family DNA or RNA helicase
VAFKGSLREYQEEAVERMVDRGQMLLGMVMGAGKTPTTIAAVEALHQQGDVDRCLVVVPASLKFQWRSEIKKFTDAPFMVIDGPKAKRLDQWKRSALSRYVVVNPETLVNDEKSIGVFQAIVVDESTMLKTRSTKRTRLVKRVGKGIPFRFALTGQPIENRPEELFSIMEFVDKDVLGDFKTFDHTFIVRDHWGKPTRYRNLDRMHKAMRECMVRKTREDIADQLPEVIHQLIPVEFDSKGAAAYRAISNDLLSQISTAMRFGSGSFSLWSHYNDPEGNEAQGQVMARLVVLRMLCDNPELVRRSALNFDDPDVSSGSQYASDIVKAGLLDGVTAAPKLSAVLDYIEEVLSEDENNKVVLFSFFKDNLRLIQKATKHLTDSVLFMGGMSAEEKDAAKKRFQTDPKCRLFLSSDAGGYGVDLPNANYLISYDLPWSSGKLEQREARIIRLSSEFPHVTIATFVMEGSIEERQYQMLQMKKKTNEAFIDGRHHDAERGIDMTLDSLSSFLRESTV